MPDRESVITHLQIIHTWAAFARERDLQFFTAKHLEDIAQWSDDAIELLKEQGAQKFLVDENGKITPLPIVIPNCPLKEQEKIVRCKDCKISKLEKVFKNVPTSTETVRWCELINRYVDDDWFCADGGRLGNK